MDDSSVRYVRLGEKSPSRPGGRWGKSNAEKRGLRKLRSINYGDLSKSSSTVSTGALPRIMPRKLKGRFRKAESYGNLSVKGETFERGRISVLALYSSLSLDKIYASLEYTKESQRSASFSRPSTRFTQESPSWGQSQTPNEESQRRKEFTISDPLWHPKMIFDVLHLTRPRRVEGSRHKPLVAFDEVLEYENGDAAAVIQQHSDGANDADDEDEFDGGKTAEVEDDTKLDVFLFSFGCAVFWNFDPSEEQAFINSLHDYADREYVDPDLIDSAMDDMEFYYGQKSTVRNDTVRLSSRKTEEKLAVSYAFAQSSRLSIYEWRLDKIIQRNEQLPQELAMTGTIHMSMKDINKEIGRLFMERNSINLESDLLGKPDFFWEHDEWYDPDFSILPCSLISLFV